MYFGQEVAWSDYCSSPKVLSLGFLSEPPSMADANAHVSFLSRTLTVVS